MRVLEKLEPRRIFFFFEELCATPHGSTHTRAISDYCVRFAEERGLRCRRDEANNVVIWKDAAPGCEAAAPVILQGHLDMVCETEPGCTKDMEREGLELFTDGDEVGARGTTLGGDDGIAVAMALAILDADDLPHPPLEVVLTTEEEIGMLGAAALDVSDLKGRRLLNIDSEAEGVLTVGCAGGNLTRCTLPVVRAPWTGAALKVTVGGLTGGHSGEEIDRGRGNATVLLGRALYAMSRRTQLRLVRADGGLKDNAIPREASAQILAADAQSVRASAEKLEAALRRELCPADPDVFVRVDAGAPGLLPMDAQSTARCVCLLTCAPNGVQTREPEMPGQVRTSLNLGVLTTQERTVTAEFCVRSSMAAQKEMMTERLRCLTEGLGGAVEVRGEYPAWEYRPDSPLRELMTRVFTEQYGRPPRIEVIHAGVECGLLCGKLPGLDCVSYGPDLTDIHTPRERMHIESVRRVWAFTREVLKRCC